MRDDVSSNFPERIAGNREDAARHEEAQGQEAEGEEGDASGESGSTANVPRTDTGRKIHEAHRVDTAYTTESAEEARGEVSQRGSSKTKEESRQGRLAVQVGRYSTAAQVKEGKAVRERGAAP